MHYYCIASKRKILVKYLYFNTYKDLFIWCRWPNSVYLTISYNI
nr:MAG TPA: hypothetical protein [Caudoviricetes sp.]